MLQAVDVTTPQTLQKSLSKLQAEAVFGKSYAAQLDQVSVRPMTRQPWRLEKHPTAETNL